MTSVESRTGVPAQRIQRPTETAVGHEVLGQADFSIRGHHLLAYSWLTKGQYSHLRDCDIRPQPVALATRLAISYKAELDRMKEKQILGEDTEQDRQQLRYAHDNIKETDEDLSSYLQRNKDHYEKFNALPDDALVDITAKKDTECQTCPLVGNHCQISADTFGKEGATRIARDVRGIALVMEEATRLGLGEQVGTYSDMTDYVDRDNVEYTALRMRVGVLRQILQVSELLNEPIRYSEE